jgi:hypothetical protein
MGLACNPAPHTRVCAGITRPDLRFTWVDVTDSTTSPQATPTFRPAKAFSAHLRRPALNIVKISGPASTRTICAFSWGISG